ncbi:Voltage-gated ClC-type chloride channel ClcB [Ralstonia condita]|uniref:Chloride channel core n=3 Tax=Ralstonia TaxID=48736 RepID=C6BM63_RALP1|nr:ClcB-like voltage-gated chloride channel protein [Ralstonia sp. LMG 7141]CAJ0787084.1 Voltage-gated ClC-type chloride channel ClcB [Ralstonia sp. LMG 7141]
MTDTPPPSPPPLPRPAWWQRVAARLPFGRVHLVFVFAGLIGCAGAFSTILFRECLRQLQWWISGTDQGLVATARALPWWARLLVPTVGGILAGLTLQFGLKWIPRKGSEDYMEAIAVGDGVLSARQSLVRSASSLCSVASGASIGREGPMVQLSAMCGSLLGRALRRVMPVSVEQLRLLVACGAAAGITSAYNAPIAGAVFVCEIVFGVITTATLGPLLVAAVTADIVLRQFFGYGAVYEMPHFDFVSGWEVLTYLGLGLAAGMAGPLLLGLIDRARDAFSRTKLPLTLRLAVGGLIVGVLSTRVPEVWGNGYSVVNGFLHEPWLWQTVALVLICKVAATAASAGSGAVGGVFTPTLFCGAALGLLYGTGMHALLPGAAPVPISYAVVGMGALLAATTHAPLMSILMIFEMTLSYQVVLPLMLACITGYVTAHATGAPSVYARALARNRDDAQHLPSASEATQK